MTHTPHDLLAEFPNEGAILHELKTADAHFRQHADAYHDLNREIHRIEVGIDAASDTRLEDLKKRRLGLLDEVSQMVAAAKRAHTL
jgi:uncharacterized protein